MLRRVNRLLESGEVEEVDDLVRVEVEEFAVVGVGIAVRARHAGFPVGKIQKAYHLIAVVVPAPAGSVA